MVLDYTLTQHAECYPSKVLASNGGRHILNLLLSADCDNGWFLGCGSYVSLDLYNDAAATSFEGTVVERAANGNYYVEVASTSNCYLVCQIDDHAEEWTNTWKTARPYNKSGDVVRAYELAPKDIIELSVECFTATPTVGDSVELSGKKLAKA